MTIHQEIRKTLKDKGPHIIEESIAPLLKSLVAEYSHDLLTQITKLDSSNVKQFNRTYNRIYADLIGQTIRYLIKLQCERP